MTAVPPLVDITAVLVGGLTGSLLAVRKQFDLVGVASLAIVAGLGGGIIRDVLLQHGPPAALQDSRYLVVALIAAGVGFTRSTDVVRISRVLTVVDALNLGIFTIVGAAKALNAGIASVPAAFLGIATVDRNLLALTDEVVGRQPAREILAGDLHVPHVLHRGAAQPKPRMNFASSDILSGVHGGSNVSSVSTASTSGISCTTRSMSCSISGPAGQPIDVRL